MRLLHLSSRNKVSLTGDLTDNLPPYAILSHTWGSDDDEVTFADIGSGRGQKKAGHAKILFCGEQARRDGIEYFWVDTCCINKANHVELSEAITSMFRWYQNAVRCYVYLPDVSAHQHEGDGLGQRLWETEFRHSRWFTRGWTLQELLAPKIVQFYSRERQLLGDKSTLALLIHEITKIPMTAYLGTPLAQFSNGERMRWATGRETKKREDKAYCLFGIFGVYLPLIYGEGEYAFSRLQEAISQREHPITEYVHTHWMVSRPANSLFTGRQSLIMELENTIRDAVDCPWNRVQCRIVISGIGGQGKSEICLQLANRLRQVFWAVFWIDVSTKEMAQRSFLDFAQRMFIPAQDWEEARLGIANLKYPWLLLLDNADDLDVDYQDYFPESRLGVVVITTRDDGCHQLATEKPVALEGLDGSDARDLLLKAACVAPDQLSLYERDADVVAELLQSHPLALIQAGSYVQRGQCNLSDYPRLYDKERRRLLSYRPRQAQSRYCDVYTTFEVSAQTLLMVQTDAAQDALDLLPLLAVCEPGRLPLFVFEIAWQGANVIHVGKEDDTHDEYDDSLTKWHVGHLPLFIRARASAWDSLRMTEAVELLKAYSLVSVTVQDGSTYISTHALVHAWAYDRQTDEQHHQSWIRIGCVVALALTSKGSWLPSQKKTLQPHVEALTKRHMKEIFATEEPGLVVHILQEFGMFFHSMSGLHANGCLDALMKRIFAHLALDWWYVKPPWLGLYDLYARTVAAQHTVSVLEQVVLLKTQSAEFHDPVLLEYQTHLATAYGVVHEFDSALAMMSDIMEVQEQMLPLEDDSRLRSQRALANIYRYMDKPEERMRLLEEIVEIEARTLAEDDPARMNSQLKLAEAYEWDGRHRDAAEVLERVVKVQSRVLSKLDHERLSVQYRLATAYRRTNRNREAIGLLEEMVKIGARSEADPRSPSQFADTQLARAYCEEGQFEKAAEVLEDAIRYVEQERGTWHENELDLRSLRQQLAGVRMATAKFPEAVKLLEDVVSGWSESYGEDSSAVLISQKELARAYCQNQQVERAVEVAESIVKVQQRTLPETHVSLLMSQQNLAVYLWKSGERETSPTLMAHVGNIRRLVNEPDDPDLRDCEWWLAEMETASPRRRDVASSGTIWLQKLKNKVHPRRSDH